MTRRDGQCTGQSWPSMRERRTQRRDRICFVEPPSVMAVQQNAWSGHSPDTSDELRIESTLYTNPPDYTGAHRNTHVSTRPVVLFPAINTSEHRAGHVKQAHRKRWACFTLSYSPWSGSTGQGIKNPRAERRVSGLKTSKNKPQGYRTRPNRSPFSFMHSHATR